jgi:multicomponent Na+:H+ antiporter subunit G
MNSWLDAWTAIAVSAGVFFFLAGTAGWLRFPDPLARLHAVTKADNLGLGLVVLGLVPRAASVADALQLVAIWLLALLGAATAGQLAAGIARAAGSRS